MNDEAPALEITAEARASFVEAVKADPYTGIAAAALAAGIPGSRGQRKQLVAADAEIQLAIQEARRDYLAGKGLDVDTLLGKLSHVVNDDGNSSQLRAIQTGLHLNGIASSEVQRVEVTGADGAALEVTVEHDYGRILDKLADVGLLRRGPAAAVDAAPLAVLPARTD